MKKCSECKWYREGNNKRGECHRMPPTVVNGGCLMYVFPQVTNNDWCGEWRCTDEALRKVLEESEAVG